MGDDLNLFLALSLAASTLLLWLASWRLGDLHHGAVLQLTMFSCLVTLNLVTILARDDVALLDVPVAAFLAGALRGATMVLLWAYLLYRLRALGRP